MGGLGVILGRLAADLPAEILIPVMVVVISLIGYCYIKDKIPKTLTMHSLLFFIGCGFMMMISVTLGWPWAVSCVFILLGVAALEVMCIAEARRLLRADVVGYNYRSGWRRNRVWAVFYIVLAVYLAALTIGLCCWSQCG